MIRDCSSRIRRQQAESLGIHSAEGEGGGGPHPVMTPQDGCTYVGHEAPEVEDKNNMEREEEERQRREAQAEPLRRLETCLPQRSCATPF